MANFTIPDYRIGEQLPKGSAPGLQLDVPMSAFGSPQAEALQRFGSALDRAVDANRVEKLINVFIGKKQEALFNGQDAFYRRKGQQALEAGPQVSAQLAGLRDTMLADAANDDERAVLAPRLDLHIADAMDGMGRHLAAERVTRNRDVLGERQALIRRAAELEHDNDDKIAGLAEAQASAARELARLDGVAPDSSEEIDILHGARSQILRTAIEQRIANAKGPQAITLYDRVKQTLSPADRRALELPIGVAIEEAATDAWLARESGTDGAPLADRAGLDDTLSDQQRLILLAKIGARESAEESHRFATVKGLDDRLAAATATIATRPALYRPGTLAALADAYAGAGAPEQADETRRLALLESYLRTFAQAGAAAQQRHLDDLTGPERAMAETILRHQDDAFAHDAYAAGTALYPDVGPPLEDSEGRLFQERTIASLRGISMPPHAKFSGSSRPDGDPFITRVNGPTATAVAPERTLSDSSEEPPRDGDQIAQAPEPDGTRGRPGLLVPEDEGPIKLPPHNDRASPEWAGSIVVLPDGSLIEDPFPDRRNHTGYVMAPVNNLEEVAEAGRRDGIDYRATRDLPIPGADEQAEASRIMSLFGNVGTGGRYDTQRGSRSGQIMALLRNDFIQHRQFRPIANINVGLYGQQFGLTLEQTLGVAGMWARIASSNTDPNAPNKLDARTEYFIRKGYEISAKGLFDSNEPSLRK